MTIHQKQNDPGHFYTEFDMAPDYSKGMRISVQPSQAEEALGPSGENVGRDIPPDVPVIIYDGQGLK